MPVATSLPIIGANLAINNIDKVADITARGGQPLFALMTTTLGNDGKKYTFAKANAALASALATCAIAPTTGLVTATLGTFVAPTITGGMAVGDCAWFAQPSVA